MIHESINHPKPQPDDSWHPKAVIWFRWCHETFVGDVDLATGIELATKRLSAHYHHQDWLDINGEEYIEGGKRRVYHKVRLAREALTDWKDLRREFCLDQGEEPTESRKPRISGRYS